VVTSSAHSFERNPGKPGKQRRVQGALSTKGSVRPAVAPERAEPKLDHEQSGLEGRRAPHGLAEHQGGGPVAEVKVRADIELCQRS
jgi:hypothetical protein